MGGLETRLGLDTGSVELHQCRNPGRKLVELTCDGQQLFHPSPLRNGLRLAVGARTFAANRDNHLSIGATLRWIGVGRPTYPGAQPGSASSNPLNSKAGATMQEMRA